MSTTEPEPHDLPLRRSWPQRLLMLASIGLIGGLVFAALSLKEIDETAASIPRVDFSIETPDGEAVDVQPGEPLNFLIVGTDNAEGLDPDDPVHKGRQTGSLLTDVLIVLRLDPATGRAAVMSIPRDLRVEYASTGSGKVNAAYYYGTARGEGHAELGQTIVDNLDIPIHKYVEIDFAGFAELVDAIDGVPVYFANPAKDEGSFLDVKAPGCWILDGDEALSYVRGRFYEEFIDDQWVFTGRNDFDRNERQQDFLILAAERAVDRIGRSPVSIRQFLNGVKDAEAVTLDDTTSIQELIDLAQAFADFNPETLERYELPVGLITGTTDYALIEGQAKQVLDVFRGYAGLEGASTVEMTATGDEEEIGYIADRGFSVSEIDEDLLPFDFDFDETVLVVSPDQLEAARVVGSWLIELPPVETVAGEEIVHLHLGDDYAGVGIVPWAADADEFVEWQADLPVETTITTPDDDDPEESSTSAQAGAGSADGDVDDSADADDGSTTTTEPDVLGRPPEGLDCEPLP